MGARPRVRGLGARGAGRAFALRVLEHMRERLQDYQEQTGHLYNLEATPAEGTAYRQAHLEFFPAQPGYLGYQASRGNGHIPSPEAETNGRV